MIVMAKRAVRYCATLVAAIICTILCVIKFIYIIPSLWRVKSALFVQAAGFGHTIQEPDWLRRYHPGSIVFFGYTPGRNNSYTTHLWQADRVRFVWIRVGVRFPVLGVVPGRAWASVLIEGLCAVVRFIRPNLPTMTLEAIATRFEAAEPHAARELRIDERGHFGAMLSMIYQHETLAVPAPRLRMPAYYRNKLERSLRKFSSSDFKMRTTLYLRSKGGAADSSNRSGSAIADHADAITLLNQYGYQVFVVGDLTLTDELRSRFGVGALDYKTLNLEKNLFAVLAATETDLFVGNSGGGQVYAVANGVRSLIIDGFPFAANIPRSTIYYKFLTDATGALVPPRELFSRYLSDFEINEPGYRLLNNTPEQIAEAVKDFLDNRTEDWPYGVDLKTLDLERQPVVFDLLKVRISPAWLRRFSYVVPDRHQSTVTAAVGSK